MDKIKFVNITQFAKIKKVSRETLYKAERNGEIEVDRSSGFPVIFLTEKNKKWKPRPKGRPISQMTKNIIAEIQKEIEESENEK